MNRFYQSLVRCFLTGVAAVLPLVITVAIVIWVANAVGKFLGPNAILGRLLRQVGLQFASNTAVAYVIGWVVVLAGIFVLGVLVEIGARRFVLGALDSLLNRVPLLGSVYSTSRQILGMMDKKKDSDLKGMSVVFCIFGTESGAAFLGLLPTPNVYRVGDVDYHAVLVPTAPIPMGGSLIFVPTHAVRPAGISVDAFMSIYVSMGVSGPQFLHESPAKQ